MIYHFARRCSSARRVSIVKCIPARGCNSKTDWAKFHPDGLPRYPRIDSANGLLRCVDWAGTVAFAVTGTAAAGLAGLDALGCTIVGTITATGGGTVRDIVIGNLPVFWVVEYEYMLMCLATCTATLLLWEYDEPFFRKIVDGREMFWLDSIGIGGFCAIGAQNGIRRGCHPVICILLGVLTSTFGGITRDVLTKSPVRVLHSNAEIYASCAGAGATVYMGIRALGLHPAIRIGSAMVTAVSLRYWAVENDIKLPLAPPFRVKKEE